MVDLICRRRTGAFCAGPGAKTGRGQHPDVWPASRRGGLTRSRLKNERLRGESAVPGVLLVYSYGPSSRNGVLHPVLPDSRLLGHMVSLKTCRLPRHIFAARNVHTADLNTGQPQLITKVAEQSDVVATAMPSLFIVRPCPH